MRFLLWYSKRLKWVWYCFLVCSSSSSVLCLPKRRRNGEEGLRLVRPAQTLKKKNVVFFGFSSERSEFQGLGFVSCFAAAASSSSCSTPREREREMGKGKVLKRMERLGMDKCVAQSEQTIVRFSSLESKHFLFLGLICPRQHLLFSVVDIDASQSVTSGPLHRLLLSFFYF